MVKPTSIPNAYAGGALDRAHRMRRDRAWLHERLLHPGSAVLPLWQGQPLIRQAEAPAPALIGASEISAAFEKGDWALLGVAGDQAVFALELGLSGAEAPDLSRFGTFTELRQVGPILAREDAALLAYARGLMLWHGRNRFCGACGAPTRSEEGGHQRRCTNEACAIPHFPRTDPAVIMLVTSGDKALLGRQSAWPAGMLSHGDKRKLEIAMLLAAEPRVILLDEPMAGVSAEDVDGLVEVIRAAHEEEGRTVLLVEHRMEVVVGLAQRIAVMHHGALLAFDTPERVMADETVQTAYLGEPL